MKRFLIACVWLAGCVDDTRSSQTESEYEAALPSVGNRLAVLGSDYKSSALSLVAADTQARVGSALWHSGSQVSAATTALSGDAALAQTPWDDGRIVVIDRGNAVITFWDPTNRAVRQIPVSTGFYSNPQDVIPIDAHKMYVVRMKRNPTPSADPTDLDEGDDVLIVDPTDGKLLGRLDLAPYAAEKGLVAAGSRAVKVYGHVWLPLQSLAADFSHQGDARILEIDPEKNIVVSKVDIQNIKNCIAMTWQEDIFAFVAVCPGAYSDKADQGAHAGVVLISPGNATPSAQVLFHASDFGGAATLGRDVACVPGGHCLVTTPGDPDSNTPDRLWRFETAGGKPVEVAKGSGPFSFSGMHAHVASQHIVLGDRTNPSGDVRIFALTAMTTTERPAVSSNPGGLGAIDFGVF